MYQNCPDSRFYCNSQKIAVIRIFQTCIRNYHANSGFYRVSDLRRNIFLAKGQRIYVALRHDKAQM